MRRIAGCVFCDGTKIFLYQEGHKYLLYRNEKVVREYENIENALRDFEELVVEERKRKKRTHIPV